MTAPTDRPQTPFLEMSYGLQAAYTDLRGAEATLGIMRAAVGAADSLSCDSRPISTHELGGALDGARAQVDRALNLLIEIIDAADTAHRAPRGGPGT